MDDAEARAILREHGEEPPIRGRLNDDWRARAEAFRADAPEPSADYDGGVSDADFTGLTEAAEPPALPAERKPRKVTAKRGTGGRAGFYERWQKQRGKKKPGPKPKRMSLAPVIGEFWGLMGSLAGRVDVPLGRCLQMQSPVAGEILEDVVKGTIVDTALQPIARAEDKAKAVGALVLPPVIVLAIEHAHTLPKDQMEARMMLLQPMLVQSLMMWERVAGDKMEAMAARVEQEAPSRERAERTADLIFAMTAPAAPKPQPETVDV